MVKILHALKPFGTNRSSKFENSFDFELVWKPWSAVGNGPGTFNDEGSRTVGNCLVFYFVNLVLLTSGHYESTS